MTVGQQTLNWCLSVASEVEGGAGYRISATLDYFSGYTLCQLFGRSKHVVTSFLLRILYSVPVPVPVLQYGNAAALTKSRTNFPRKSVRLSGCLEQI